jgi:hypothetical protein
MLLLLRTLLNNDAILRIRYVAGTKERPEGTGGFARERSSCKLNKELNNSANLYIVHAAA